MSVKIIVLRRFIDEMGSFDKEREGFVRNRNNHSVTFKKKLSKCNRIYS